MDGAVLLGSLMAGLAGAPHCAAMCAAPCAAACAGAPSSARLGFHLTRLLGYAAAGAVAASSIGLLADAAQFSAVLRPLWALLHAAGLALGLWMLIAARQPLWLARSSRSPGASLGQPKLAGGGAVQVMRTPWSAHAKPAAWGAAWVAWPCGLLQTALLMSALASSAAAGAAAMSLFALASAPGLMVAGSLAPILVWANRRGWQLDSARWSRLSARAAGLTLVLASLWTLAGPTGQRALCLSPG